MNSNALIQCYYMAFNQRDMKTFFNLLDENVIHDINQGGTEIGKQAFINFMQRMNHCYEETIKDLRIMTDESGMHAAAEFAVEGTYLVTDHGLSTAKGQRYILPGGAFFTIKIGKITRITNYYNLNDWLKQIQEQTDAGTTENHLS